MKFIDRRAFPRLPFNVEIRYKVAFPSEKLPVSRARGKDISAGGIRLVIFERLDSETSLDLIFFLPDSATPIYATGLVTWSQEHAPGQKGSKKAYEVGIEFISIKEKDRAKIKQYVRSKM